MMVELLFRQDIQDNTPEKAEDELPNGEDDEEEDDEDEKGETVV